ncbi:Zn-ribbon-containing protein|uniref:Predicted nucleic acid-binding protein, contains Zn-ribbon domain n=1 Tax=Dendrosporobacter quercicolus TaxID=146817 RepID=A0A1G9SQC4_9FIRM|nr:Zn-ribbon-containing protein [Dendrosporobacter quercicolus]NSL48661.1 Zn-ribbon-containing protein [Dendrosporobacter quercicolus DSM 1736]SDM37065.1 Predicted nucleic acid-binding protein, contains Zn-ribbon domain [Dendrosporobacter quercicolus]
MFVAEITFIQQEEIENSDQIPAALEFLLGALRMNGQILGREYPIANRANEYRSYVLIPELVALNAERANSYVLDAIKQLKKLGIEYSWEIIGSEPECIPQCSCTQQTSFILYTTYLALEAPLRCGDCFGIVPLYRIPATKNDEYSDILSWESDYKACDTLQMNCSTGEKFGIAQLSKHDSSLSQRGIAICKQITAATGIPTYYYLLRVSGRSKRSELKIKCPSCNDEWLLREPLHRLFDFQCDNCRLLSNIAWSIRSK